MLKAGPALYVISYVFPVSACVRWYGHIKLGLHINGMRLAHYKIIYRRWYNMYYMWGLKTNIKIAL